MWLLDGGTDEKDPARLLKRTGSSTSRKSPTFRSSEAEVELFLEEFSLPLRLKGEAEQRR